MNWKINNILNLFKFFFMKLIIASIYNFYNKTEKKMVR